MYMSDDACAGVIEILHIPRRIVGPVSYASTANIMDKWTRME